MRLLFGCLAIILGVVSIALAARYGVEGADTIVDGTISATVFGLVALCAFLFDAAGVRLWFIGHRIGSIVIGLIAAAALVVTFTNSLGTIASRADTTLAERTKMADARQDDRRELAPAGESTSRTRCRAAHRRGSGQGSHKGGRYGSEQPRRRMWEARHQLQSPGAGRAGSHNASGKRHGGQVGN